MQNLFYQVYSGRKPTNGLTQPAILTRSAHLYFPACNPPPAQLPWSNSSTAAQPSPLNFPSTFSHRQAGLACGPPLFFSPLWPERLPSHREPRRSTRARTPGHAAGRASAHAEQLAWMPRLAHTPLSLYSLLCPWQSQHASRPARCAFAAKAREGEQPCPTLSPGSLDPRTPKDPAAESQLASPPVGDLFPFAPAPPPCEGKEGKRGRRGKEEEGKARHHHVVLPER
jgi:hypothetical protein